MRRTASRSEAKAREGRRREVGLGSRQSIALAALVLGTPATAQVTGSWGPSFNHSLNASHPTNKGTDPFLTGFNLPGAMPPPAPPAVNATATQNYFWGQGNFTALHHAAFNAVHMALIPKGPNQGKVLVWGGWFPVVLTPPTAWEPQGNQWFCQAWSVIDPNADASQIRFRNYLLPLMQRPFYPPPNVPTVELIADLFCSGHAWSQEGDLVVAGGATALVQLPAPIPPLAIPWPGAPNPGPGGAKWTFLFDPAAAHSAFPGQAQPIYGGTEDFGRWVRGPDMAMNRWYPTVTLSQVLTRGSPALNNEVMMISGGTDGTQQTTPDNNYETFVIRSRTDPAGWMTGDPDPNAGLPTPLWGPGPANSTLLPDEILWEYPRLHLLSDGSIFHSGPKPLGAKVEQNFLASPLPAPFQGTAFERPWDNSVGRNAASWPFTRDDGASVFLHSNGTDLIIRLGGGQGPATFPPPGLPGTDTTEYWKPASGPDWNDLGPMTGGPRQFLNAVVLPDASILVIGGADPLTATPVLDTSIYRASVGWEKVVAGDSPTRRTYHSTAVLLPDGRVFVGGGELLPGGPQTATEADYDIYSPHYLQGSPTRPVITAVTDTLNATLPRDSTDSAFHLSSGPQFRVQVDDLLDLDRIDRLVLIAPGSVTHHSDMSARFVDITGSLLPGSSAKMQFQLPGSTTLPRGFYMMFALNTSGVPSVATWVKVI